MAYELDTSLVDDLIDDLPVDAREACDGALSVLSLVPWNGLPMIEANPDGQYRWIGFSTTTGFGFLYYVVMENLGEVSVDDLLWCPYD